jgi:hypothetical protein
MQSRFVCSSGKGGVEMMVVLVWWGGKMVIEALAATWRYRRQEGEWGAPPAAVG